MILGFVGACGEEVEEGWGKACSKGIPMGVAHALSSKAAGMPAGAAPAGLLAAPTCRMQVTSSADVPPLEALAATACGGC